MGEIVKGPADYFKLGDFNAECSISGFKRKASQLVKNWQGQYRIPEFNEPRQPQDFVRGVQDVQSVPWVQPPREIFIEICTYNGLSAIPGLAEPGCMIPGRSVWNESDFVVVLPGPPQVLTTDMGQPIQTDDGRDLVTDIGGGTTSPDPGWIFGVSDFGDGSF